MLLIVNWGLGKTIIEDRDGFGYYGITQLAVSKKDTFNKMEFKKKYEGDYVFNSVVMVLW